MPVLFIPFLSCSLDNLNSSTNLLLNVTSIICLLLTLLIGLIIILHDYSFQLKIEDHLDKRDSIFGMVFYLELLVLVILFCNNSSVDY